VSDTIRILLADDHAILRAGLKLMLDQESDMTVVGEAADGSELLAQAREKKPDVVLLDISMPLLSGLDCLPLLRKHVPLSRIVILTMHEEDSYLRQALADGAAGFVLKKAASTELVLAIRAVVRGGIYVHPSLIRVLLDDMLPRSDALASDWQVSWNKLSERERSVLKLTSLGYTGREIAEKLSLSSKTIDTYRSRGMDKLGLRGRAALVRFTLAHGLIDDSLN